MKKFILSIVAVCLSVFVFAFVGCGSSSGGIESTLKSLCSAESFTVSEGNTTILQYSGKTLYWKYGYNGEYDEYYFSPDDEGKYWVYERDYNDDAWTKSALPIVEYYGYVYILKAGLGIDEMDFFALIDCVCMDFSSCTVENDGKYTLVNGFSFDNITFWQDGEDLIFDNGTTKYTISSINKTEIEFPASLDDAVVGEVSLP